MEQDRKSTAFCGLFSSWLELQLPVATELRNLDSFALKKALMQELKELQAEAIDMGFSVADTGVKNALFSFIKMASTGMVQQRLTDKVIHNSFEH